MSMVCLRAQRWPLAPDIEDLVISTSEPDTDLLEHLAECAECQHELGEMERTFHLLGFLAPVAVPPDDIKSRLLMRIRK
jgi:hypothetical protein